MFTGNIRKMKTFFSSVVEYKLPIGDRELDLNSLISKKIKMKFHNEINCIYCGIKTKKSFSNGYCFKHFRNLAQCDVCIIKPEKCHYFEGTCREPEWGDENCMRPHYVYLANTSHIKVGITKEIETKSRWMDQGASFVLPIIRVSNRRQAGLFEQILSKYISDKTNWRKMLKGELDEVSLEDKRDELFSLAGEELDYLEEEMDDSNIEFLEDETVIKIDYPVSEIPEKFSSMSFDKLEEIEGVLLGIKGQYLILDSGVLNIRKHAGYKISLEY